ncbi:MAG: response regulator transcription factor [Lachnospiraceae bacterium]|nr:response regulator transcription factor [Lachnospiraceae bacterium]MBR4780396.1 response regulator transcription factor [Lachnospiraceae bacterium]MBR6474787.1 response regulator transcription factor [Lachnospiraceae bacterium]
MNNKTNIIVVEDDRQIRKLMQTTLSANGYNVECVSDGGQAILALTTNKFDIVLLDLGLPDIDGITVIKKIREWSSIPIIVISARGEDSDKISALDNGADDYLTKPFSLEELMARIRVAQRRLANITNESESIFRNGDLVVDYPAGTAYLKGEELSLTPIEYKLLCLLSQNAGKVLTHTFITNTIWGNTLETDVASLRVFMASLRKKIEKDTAHPEYIQTHIGTGYRMIIVKK